MTHTPGAVALANAIRRARKRRSFRRESGRRFREAREKLHDQLRRGFMWPLKPCPTPGVEAFRELRDVDVAAVAVMRASNNRVLCGGHLCECGYWHLTVRPAESEWGE